MAMNNYIGIVTKVELKKYDSYDACYQPYASEFDIKLMIAIETDNGPIWFYTPKISQRITCPPLEGIAVSIVMGNDWIGKRNTLKENVIGLYPTSKISVGQTLTIRGRDRRQTQYGKQINYVKLLEIADGC